MSFTEPSQHDPPERSWAEVLGRLVTGADLPHEDAAWAMDQVMRGEATPAQVAGFAVALGAKGETSVEVRAMAETMLAHAHRLRVDRPAVDIVGTGADRAGTVNISTMASLVVAATGVAVVKHGNRAASSQCGTADVLEHLGVAIDLSAGQVRDCVDEVGIGFCFAAAFHPAFRHTAGPRRELGIPTAFNFLGPLTNPAQPSAGLIGCANTRMAPVLAEVFAARGDSTIVVRGDDGLDEITTTTTTSAWFVHSGTVRRHHVDPGALGIPLVDVGALRGGDAAYNAEVVRAVLGGKQGPVRDAVLLNAAAALVAREGNAGSAGGEQLHERLRGAMRRAAEAVDSGAAARLLERWIAHSTRLHKQHGQRP